MNAAENKRLMHEVLAKLAQGNGQPFVEALAEDPLFAQFQTGYRARATRLVAEGDCVVIEFRGDVVTKAGKPYRNSYCYVCRLAEGKVRELTENCDTQLLRESLASPAEARRPTGT